MRKAAVKNGGKGKKSVAVMTAVALLLALAVGGTVAYIAASSPEIANQFLPAQVSCAVSGDAPTNIFITNTGNISAYIRAAVVVNWMDASGNVYGIAPSYQLTIDEANWTEVDGFFYYNSDVPANSNNTTVPLIKALEVTGTAPAGYTLSVEVVAEAIQAEGGDGTASAAELAWGVKLSGGQWTLSNEQQN